VAGFEDDPAGKAVFESVLGTDGRQETLMNLTNHASLSRPALRSRTSVVYADDAHSSDGEFDDSDDDDYTKAAGQAASCARGAVHEEMVSVLLKVPQSTYANLYRRAELTCSATGCTLTRTTHFSLRSSSAAAAARAASTGPT